MKKINNQIKRKLRNRKKLKNVNVNRLRISVSKSLIFFTILSYVFKFLEPKPPNNLLTILSIL